MLIPLTSSHLTTQRAPLTPSPLCLPWVCLKKASSLLLWWTSSCDARISKTRMSLCIATLNSSSISISFQAPPCDVLVSAIQSHLCHCSLPPVHQFIQNSLSCSSHCSVGGNKWQIQVRQARFHQRRFQLWMKGACMRNEISMIELQIIVIFPSTPELLLVIGHLQKLFNESFLKTKAMKLM